MTTSKKQRRDFVLKALGEQIRIVRIEQKMTQEQLGLAANLHRTYITDIESGLRNLSFLTLLRVSRALRCSVSKLILAAESSEGWNADIAPNV